MTQGFLAVPRWLQDEFEGEGELFGFYMMLAMKAWYSDGQKPLREGGVLLRGQLVNSEREMAEWWHRRPTEKGRVQVRSQVRRFLKRLVVMGRIGLDIGPQNGPEKSPKKTRNATVTTIIDYSALFYDAGNAKNKKEPNVRPKIRPNVGPMSAQCRPTENKGTRKKGNKVLNAGAREPRLKKPKGALTPQDEAHRIGRLLFMPPNERGDKPARFVDLVALDAAMDDALADVGIEALRAWHLDAKTRSELGLYLFNANNVPKQARRYLPAVERIERTP